MSPAANSTSRWCPTPEQVMILEEMYRTGIRTPNASEIQHITSHLSFYGKIEGKNVFYWFQNHKARDRQKLKRKLFKQLHHQQQQPLFQHNSHFLGSSFQSPTTTSFQQFSCFNSSTGHLHLQGNGVVEDESNQLLNYKNLEIPLEKLEMNNSNSLMRLYGRDCMMMMEGMNHSPHLLTEAACSSNINNKNNNNYNSTLKTLELFPITATNLKEETTTTIAMSKSLHACSSHIFNN